MGFPVKSHMAFPAGSTCPCLRSVVPFGTQLGAEDSIHSTCRLKEGVQPSCVCLGGVVTAPPPSLPPSPPLLRYLLSLLSRGIATATICELPIMGLTPSPRLGRRSWHPLAAALVPSGTSPRPRGSGDGHLPTPSILMVGSSIEPPSNSLFGGEIKKKSGKAPLEKGEGVVQRDAVLK